jgi:hypothetical protein
MTQIPTEHAEQVTTVGWFRSQYPQHKIFAIPNGAYLAGSKLQRAKQMQRLKAEGLETGAPDLLLPVARGGYHGLFVEMKRINGSRTSPDQIECRDYLIAQGYQSVICKGHAEAIATIKNYMEKPQC